VASIFDFTVNWDVEGRRVIHTAAKFGWNIVSRFVRKMREYTYTCTHTLWVKKTGPFWFERNFGKYWPILITLSLLQTEINCDQVYPKIYHHSSNLLVHYLVKWTGMYWLTLQAWYRNYRCNSQTSHIECNRYGQNQRCQVTSFTRNILLCFLLHGHTLDVFLATGQ